MTDTGQVPAEGLPENAGMVEEPGVPAHGAYTYLSETTAEDEDLLLLPGAQSAWGNEVAPPVPAPVVETVHEPGPHETGGRDSGSVDLTAVRFPTPAAQAAQAAPVTPRRPLHLGPPTPDASASPVRSLADRGPAGMPAPAHRLATAIPVPGPEYLDAAPQLAEQAPQGATPWGAQTQAHTAVQTAPAPLVSERAQTAETVVPLLAEVPAPAPATEAPEATETGPAVQETPEGMYENESPEAAHTPESAEDAYAGQGAEAAEVGEVVQVAGDADNAYAPEAAQGPEGVYVPEAPQVPDTPAATPAVEATEGDAAFPEAPVTPDAAQVPQETEGAVTQPEVAQVVVAEPEPALDAQVALEDGSVAPDAPVVPEAPVTPEAHQVMAPEFTPQPVPEAEPQAVAPGALDEALGVPVGEFVTPPAAEEAPVTVVHFADPASQLADTAAQVTEAGLPAEPQHEAVPAEAPTPDDVPVLENAEALVDAAHTPDDAQPLVATEVQPLTAEAVVAPPAPSDQAPTSEPTPAPTVTPPPAPEPAAAATLIPASAPEQLAEPDETSIQFAEPQVAEPLDQSQPLVQPLDQQVVEPVGQQVVEPVGQQVAEPVGQFVPVEGTLPTTPHLAPTPPHAFVLPPEDEPVLAPVLAMVTALQTPQPVQPTAPETPDPAAPAPAPAPEAAEAPTEQPVPVAPVSTVPAPRETDPTPDPAAALPTEEPETDPGPATDPDDVQLVEFVQQAEDLDTRAADQEESTAAVEDVRESTGPAAPGYDDAEREAVLKVMRERRDIRNGFRSDPIPHDVLLRILEAAHTAPSVGHSQPWDFVVIRSAETRGAMHELAARQREAYAKSLPKGRAKQFKELKIEAILDTPVNIVVTADPTRGGRHTLGRHTQPQMAPYSSALAVENLWLAARAEGIGVGWVSFFDEREMVRTLGLPEHLEVVAYLCVGYVDEFPEEPELLQAGWSKRRPLSWVVHEETYGRRALPGEEPHDLLAETVANIRPLDAKALGEAWERQKRMTKPAGALGMLEIISAQLSGLSRMCPPPIPEPAAVAIFAGDHGVHAQGVTPWPQEVTAQMVANFLGGGAVCNAFASQVGAEVCVIDVGVASDLPATPGLLPRKIRAGTSDMTTGPAMTREEAKAAIEVGIETARDLVAAGNKALLTGEMGIANTTASAALISVFTDTDPSEVTGRGTGINDETLARKTEVVRRAIDLHQPDPADPIGVLAAIGGFEHAAMVGLLLGGASLRTPVILDGVSAGAAALVARAIAPEVLAACIAGHRSAEPGHVAALNKLGLRPLVDLDLRLGEGTGALLALPMVQSTARAMHEVATFDSAGVTEK
ncbi:nicotinate-nucleotide--dimethylbenzimidazole phosphoribosyltransferase [Streptomyces sp. NPDC020898]|uniref:nicotinate-nucleotide--dimethylbenzimidazole phosphoribosyltransferase n=1 Tax=Streptomyces sp. NPDC020898 TaxID=3365101 RepID=UPI0037A2F75F